MIKFIVLCSIFVVSIATHDTASFVDRIKNSSSTVAGRKFTIPGTTQTYSGYDTETGLDAICWKSQGTNYSNTEGYLFKNDLISNFHLVGSVKLLQECPGANALTAFAPDELAHDGERLRTGIEYNYSVHLTIDPLALYETMNRSAAVSGDPFLNWITSKNEENNTHHSPWNIVSEKGERVIAIQIVLCEVTRSGFCSPFIHEESNARLAALNITKKIDYGERHGESHVHSKKYFVTIPEEDNKTNIFNISLEVPVLVNQPGSFYAIAAAQIFASDDEETDESTLYHRYDIANAVSYPYRYITVQDPAVVLTVSDTVLFCTYAFIGIVTSILLFTLWQTIKHRNHSVLQLTQGPFLIVFLIMAIIASLSSFLLEPRNDFYCRAGPVLNLLTIHVMYSITIGRLWRIYAVISPLLVQTKQSFGRQNADDTTGISVSYCDKFFTFCLDIVNKLVDSVFSCSCKKNGDTSATRNVRKQVTNRQLSIVIAFFAFPQVLFQILGVVLETPYLETEMNADESRGRVKCSCEYHHSKFTTWYMWGVYMFVSIVIILFGMASATRKLPSLLNETILIVESTVTTICLLVLGVGIIAVTESPTTSPSVQYLVKVALTNVFALSTAWRIIWPKLHMVWKGETILVSKLVSDHVSKKSNNENRSQFGRTSVSGFSMTESVVCRSDMTHSLRRFENQTSHSTSSDSLKLSSQCEETALANSSSCLNHETVSTDLSVKSFDSSPRTTSKDKPKVTFTSETLKKVPGRNKKKRTIKVSSNTSPDRLLVLKMMDLQANLEYITNRIMTGLSVPEDDWTKVRRVSSNLAHVFDHNVQFTWEQEPSSELQPLRQGTSDAIDATSDPAAAALAEKHEKYRTAAVHSNEMDENEDEMDDVEFQLSDVNDSPSV